MVRLERFEIGQKKRVGVAIGEDIGYVKFNKFTESDTIPKIMPYGKGTTNPTAEQFFTEVFDHMQSNTSNTTESSEIISELNRIAIKKNSKRIKQLAEQVRNSYASTQIPHHHNPELSLQLIPSTRRNTEQIRGRLIVLNANIKKIPSSNPIKKEEEEKKTS